MQELVSGLLQTLLAFGICFGALFLMVSRYKYMKLIAAAKGELPDALKEENLDSSSAFYIRVTEYIGANRKQPEPFHLVLLTSEGLNEQDALEIEQNIREEDFCMFIEPGKLGVLLKTELDQAPFPIHRIKEKLKAHELTIGQAHYPNDGEQVAELLAHAQEHGSTTIACPEKTTKNIEDLSPKVAALLDPLTGVLKAQNISNIMQKFFGQRRRNNLPVSMLYMDIDTLDRYNRHYGQQGGDRILSFVGHYLEMKTRETDVLGRLEQDEFLICLACPLEEAKHIAQRIVTEIRQSTIPMGSSTLRITVSIGVASAPEHGKSAGAIFNAAEKALASAKLKGRGIVMTYETSMQERSAKEQPNESF